MTWQSATRTGDSAPPLGIAAARLLNTAYFLLTAAYCILTYSSFAYQQFIRPRLVALLTTFIVWHHLWHWVAFAATVLTLRQELKRGPSRGIAWSYVAMMSVLGLALLWRPILPTVENDGPGLWLAALFLLPPLWLALHDHLATPAPPQMTRSHQLQLVRGGLGAALLVWAFHLASIPFRLQQLGDLRLDAPGAAFGAIVSLGAHLVLFAFFVLPAVIALRLSRLAQVEYWMLFALSAAGVWLLLTAQVFSALSFHGFAAQGLALELSLVITAVWSGVVRRLGQRATGPRTALGIWWAPFGVSSYGVAVTLLLLLPFATFALVQRASTFDWNFLVQNLVVISAWLLAIAAMHAIVRPGRRSLGAAPLAMAAGILLTAGVGRAPATVAIEEKLTGESFVPEFALDAYAAVDPSYRLIRDLLSVDSGESNAFYSTLRRHSLIQHVDIAPISIDFVEAPVPPARIPPPDVFLFVIDSLRRDYVAPYNPAVQFTPALANFAAEADTFTFSRHFSRYGGTGLAMPAIWAGGMVLHKEYVLPFAPMNALGKLLKGNRYDAMFSLDHITADLVASDLPYEELDRGRDEMDYDFCTTLDELGRKLESRPASSPPLFAHTRSLNLHVSKLTRGSASADVALNGFVGPAAEAIRRMDGCFGAFVQQLKAAGRYDNSLIILTSDHGDSLGEAMRWGHANTLFPEIVRTPLLIHAPARVRKDRKALTDMATFSTDITPTIYQLLDYQPRALGWVYGTPLFVSTDTPPPPREASVLVASSYGPVYGLIEDDGRSFYVADGIRGNDLAYDLSGLQPLRLGVTPDRRARSRAFISARLNELAAMYSYVPAR